MSASTPAVFHLSFHVHDLAKSREFYAGLLGCREGRSTDNWVDFDFFGHQLSLHLGTPLAPSATGRVDNVTVPMPHFGAVLEFTVWQQIADKLQAANAAFIIEPQIRFEGQAGEQHTLFTLDPSGNAIELKSISNPDELFKA